MERDMSKRTIPYELAARATDRGLGSYVRRELLRALGACVLVDPDGDVVCVLGGAS